jgi:hypothetical protein
MCALITQKEKPVEKERKFDINKFIWRLVWAALGILAALVIFGEYTKDRPGNAEEWQVTRVVTFGEIYNVTHTRNIRSIKLLLGPSTIIWVIGSLLGALERKGTGVNRRSISELPY